MYYLCRICLQNLIPLRMAKCFDAYIVRLQQERIQQLHSFPQLKQTKLSFIAFQSGILIPIMNASNAFSDYMVSYSINRSINLSPTSGKLHRQREKGSFGPTICLLNRSREKIEESTAIESRQEPMLEKILMLSLEIQRLSQELRNTRKENEENFSKSKIRQSGYLKEENQKLRSSLIRFQQSKSQQQKRYHTEIFELKQKIAISDAENRTLNRRIRELQRDSQDLQRRSRAGESAAQKAKLQASKMQLSLHYNSSNMDLHKSIVRQKAIQIQSLREKVLRCEDIINDQKFLINTQKEELTKQKLKNLENENKHLAQMEYMRKQLDYAQRQILSKNSEEYQKFQFQVKQWQNRTQTSQQQLSDKCQIISSQQQTIDQQQQRIIDLQQQLNDLEFAVHSKTIRAEQSVRLAGKQKQRQLKKANRDAQKYLQQLQTMKSTIEAYKQALKEKQNQLAQASMLIDQVKIQAVNITSEVTTKMRDKQRELRRMGRRNRQQDTSKLNKSHSLDASIVTNRLRASQVNLEQIVINVLQIKNSNDRTTKLISRSKAYAPTKDIYYAN